MTRLGRRLRVYAVTVGAALVLATVGPAVAEETTAQQDSGAQSAPKKHSKAKGAAVGGAGGAVGGGKKGAVAGATGGALYQHHKNKKAGKEQDKAEKQQEKAAK